MNTLLVHDKTLPVPSFFQVYNFGGGNGDKDREIVYAEFTEDTPALINYYYINNEYKHLFSNRLFDNCTEKFKSVGELYNHIRSALIKKGEIYSSYSPENFDFNKKVFLLDSGAFSIVKYLAKQADYKLDKFMEMLPEHVSKYYDFADALKFDIVVGFDLGGKYTEKDGEKTDSKLIKFLRNIDEDEVNNYLTEFTLKYLASHPTYYPYVFATVHGATPSQFEKNTRFILDLEKKYNTEFWGFALGGIASSKQLDESWYAGVDFKRIGSKPFKDVVAPAKAAKIVRNLVGERPIHALGCGGYPNILLNYFCGATSFDAASPVRRVGDGNLESTKIVFDPTPSKEGFSKFFIGGINTDNTLRPESCSYIKLNEVNDSMPLCGCKACKAAGNVHNIKLLYSMKEKDSEANYYSRQLIGLHAVLQHRKLCEIAAEKDSVESFVEEYSNSLFEGLKYIYGKL